MISGHLRRRFWLLLSVAMLMAAPTFGIDLNVADDFPTKAVEAAIEKAATEIADRHATDSDLSVTAEIEDAVKQISLDHDLTREQDDIVKKALAKAVHGKIDKNKGATDDDKESHDAEPQSDEKTQDASKKTEAGEEEAAVPQVEVYIPSVVKLGEAARKSKTAKLYDVVANLMPPLEDETDEGVDVDAVVGLFEKIAAWPDTSVAFTTYTQDRDGRPRWALKVDWPIDVLVDNLEELLADEATTEVLGEMMLKKSNDKAYRLELPEMQLATISGSGGGSLIASTAELTPPDAIFGFDPDKKPEPGKKRSLVYCRLNLDNEEEGNDSMFAQMAGVKDIKYGLSLTKRGSWREQFFISWNPLLGVALKSVFQKTKKPFDCPSKAYATAVVNLGSLGEAGADTMAGLPSGTLGSNVGSDLAISVVPGTGFLPLPDLFYQFRTRKKDAIIEDLRGFIKKDAKKRRDDDRPQAWFEETVDDRIVFWKDPSADGGAGLAPAYRSVLFFEKDGDDEGASRLIIASTSTWYDDAIRHWDANQKKTVRVPSSTKAHWQARLTWRNLYDLAQPWLSVVAGFSEGASMPPPSSDLIRSLTDSIVDIRIGMAGLRVRHTGPIPCGAVFVPAVAAVSLSETPDPSSEIAREKIACRYLRTLHHHCRLFKKDYGRWPANVAELDGYVDFASHPYLLRLRPQEKGIMEGLASMFTDRAKTKPDELEEDEIDDSLYVIHWSETDADWRLQVRDGEFKKYATIYIDAEGTIHRVETGESEQTPAKTKKPEKKKVLL